MLASLGWFALGVLLLALGGDSIIKGAAGLSRRLGASPFAAGLILVTVATSLPELAVNLHAVWQGHTGLALGNAVGSNVVNIGQQVFMNKYWTPQTDPGTAVKPRKKGSGSE